MPFVTFRDCAACPVLTHCSAHISTGEWEYDKGVDPCIVLGDRELILDGGEVRVV